MKPRICTTCRNCKTDVTKESRALWARSTTTKYVEILNFYCKKNQKYVRKYVTKCKHYTTNTLTEYI